MISQKRVRLYECGICDGLHRWDYDGDCRNDAERYGDVEEYAERNNVDPLSIEVWDWDSRIEADERGV